MAALTSIAMGLTALSTVSQLHEGRMAKKKAKGVAEAEKRQLADQKKKAKEERRELIKTQRAQMGGGEGFSSDPVMGGMVSQGQEVLG